MKAATLALDEDLIEELAKKLHDESYCEYIWEHHTEESKEAWRQIAITAIRFLKAK